jgi:uncharacterized membrane protein AbrB (regulator of aidB expression)
VCAKSISTIFIPTVGAVVGDFVVGCTVGSDVGLPVGLQVEKVGLKVLGDCVGATVVGIVVVGAAVGFMVVRMNGESDVANPP